LNAPLVTYLWAHVKQQLLHRRFLAGEELFGLP
jgi:hypothetical protein